MSKSRIAKNIGLSRRSLLRGMGGCAAMSQVPVLSTVLNLSLTNAAAAAIDTTGYKALVCVFLHGGIDSFHDPVELHHGRVSNGFQNIFSVVHSFCLIWQNYANISGKASLQTAMACGQRG